MEDKNYSAKLEESVRKSCQIDNGLFEKFDVKRGLRNSDGTGVLVGLTTYALLDILWRYNVRKRYRARAGAASKQSTLFE